MGGDWSAPPSTPPIRNCDQSTRQEVAAAKAEDKFSSWAESSVRGRKRRHLGERNSEERSKDREAEDAGARRKGADCQGPGTDPQAGWRVQSAVEEPDLRTFAQGRQEVAGDGLQAKGVIAPPHELPSVGSGTFFCEGPGCTVEASAVFSQLWELMSFSCSSWQIFRERISLMYGDFSTLNALQLGIGMIQLLLSMPREAPANMCKKTTPNQRQRDLLPLPLSPVGAVLRLVKMLKRSPNGFIIFEFETIRKLPKQQRRDLLLKACSQAWRFNCTVVLNGQFLNWKGPLFFSWETYTPAQKEARDNILKSAATILAEIHLKIWGQWTSKSW